MKKDKQKLIISVGVLIFIAYTFGQWGYAAGKESKKEVSVTSTANP